MKALKHIDVKSFGRLYFTFGLVIGVITAILNLVTLKMTGSEIPFGSSLIVFIVMNILVYAVIVYIGAMLFVWVYNSMGKKGKGIKIEIK